MGATAWAFGDHTLRSSTFFRYSGCRSTDSRAPADRQSTRSWPLPHVQLLTGLKPLPPGKPFSGTCPTTPHSHVLSTAEQSLARRRKKLQNYLPAAGAISDDVPAPTVP